YPGHHAQRSLSQVDDLRRERTVAAFSPQAYRPVIRRAIPDGDEHQGFAGSPRPGDSAYRSDVSGEDMQDLSGAGVIDPDHRFISSRGKQEFRMVPGSPGHGIDRSFGFAFGVDVNSVPGLGVPYPRAVARADGDERPAVCGISPGHRIDRTRGALRG